MPRMRVGLWCLPNTRLIFLSYPGTTLAKTSNISTQVLLKALPWRPIMGRPRIGARRTLTASAQAPHVGWAFRVQQLIHESSSWSLDFTWFWCPGGGEQCHHTPSLPSPSLSLNSATGKKRRWAAALILWTPELHESRSCGQSLCPSPGELRDLAAQAKFC